jgi:hypothetical protein
LVKVSATSQGAAVCNPSAPGTPVSTLTASLGPAPGANGTPLVQTPPSANDLTLCQFIQTNGSGFGICGQAVPFAANGISLSMGVGQAPAGQTVELPVQFASTSLPVNGFQADIHNDSQDLTFVSARPGPQLTNVGDALSATTQPNNDVRLTSIASSAQSVIAGGVVAYATFRLASTFNSGISAVALNNCQATSGSQRRSPVPGIQVPVQRDRSGGLDDGAVAGLRRATRGGESEKSGKQVVRSEQLQPFEWLDLGPRYYKIAVSTGFTMHPAPPSFRSL